MPNIKPGYMLKVTTWENDGDNYNTVTMDGLSRDETEFYIKVAKLFKSRNRKGDECFGNADVDDRNKVDDAIQAIVDEWTTAGKTIPKNWNPLVEDTEWAKAMLEDGDTIYNDCLHDLIGIWCEGEYYRVFDEFEVFEVPQPIKNVTSEF